jgi:hypothetical protein
MKSLKDLVETQLPDDGPLGKLDVDVSEFFGEEPETTFFRYEEPDIAKTYQIPVDAEKLLKHAPEFPGNLRMTVAMLAMGHQDPPSGDAPVALLYIQIAKKNKKLFTYLAGRFNAEFPYLMGSQQALDEEKKTSGKTEEETSSSVSSTSDASLAS